MESFYRGQTDVFWLLIFWYKFWDRWQKSTKSTKDYRPRDTTIFMFGFVHTKFLYNLFIKESGHKKHVYNKNIYLHTCYITM